MTTFSNQKILTCVLALMFLLSFLSATPNPAVSQALTKTTEAQVMGGSKCASAWGLGLALAAASLSPCGVLCASLAWYDLALIGAYCN